VLYLALLPLERLFEWAGEQLALYCGPTLGDLIVITLNKYASLCPRLGSFLTLQRQQR
jgi:hypothetical protein